ncbi:MAG: methyltransferase domain-containing protein [Ghiorsea sp.]
MNQDVNFDDLTEHFKKRIYGSRKGVIRLAVLQHDLEVCLPNLSHGDLSVLDMGAGMAQMGIKLAAMGHDVCINDISENMLGLAKEHAATLDVDSKITWHHGPFQTLDKQPYDLVLCHAVLEWLNQPEELMAKLQDFTEQGSVVSLMFYNFDALVFHNLVRGNFKKINNNDFSGIKGGLTPPNPIKPKRVEVLLSQYGFEVFYKSGVRVFSDYVGIRRGGNESDEDVLAMELKYSNQEPYVNMGRYMHFMCRKCNS